MSTEPKKPREEARRLQKQEATGLLGKLAKIIALFLAGAIVVNTWTAWSDIFTSGKWRYRMTVTVETPEGIKTGSAVREVRVEKGLKLLPEMGASIYLTGEAVVVDLGKRGILFGLIDGDRASDIVFDAFPLKDVAPLSAEGIRYYSALKNAKVILQPKKYPTFVKFRDLNDPKSVEDVRSSEIVDKFKIAYPNRRIVSFEETFGRGVSIKEVTLEMTSDSIESVVDSKLPWLNGLNGSYLHGGTTSRNAPLGLHAGNFKEGKVNGQ
jgi:hypothetical protein